MIRRFAAWVTSLFDTTPIYFTIARRYVDANGHYVGELYKYDMFAGVGSYHMIGMSLDSFPLDLKAVAMYESSNVLDLKHDFLAPMGKNTLRVGAVEPKDNEQMSRMMGKMPRRNIRVAIQNRFVEHVLKTRI